MISAVEFARFGRTWPPGGATRFGSRSPPGDRFCVAPQVAVRDPGRPPVSGRPTDPSPPHRPAHLTSPASRFTVAAMITAPNRYDTSACRSTVVRISLLVRFVSETWKVIPTVNAR